MTEQMAAATTRLATLTSIIRTRRQDAERTVFHAGSPRDLSKRTEARIISLERRIETLEKAIS